MLPKLLAERSWRHTLLAAWLVASPPSLRRLVACSGPLKAFCGWQWQSYHDRLLLRPNAWLLLQLRHLPLHVSLLKHHLLMHDLLEKANACGDDARDSGAELFATRPRRTP